MTAGYSGASNLEIATASQVSIINNPIRDSHRSNFVRPINERTAKVMSRKARMSVGIIGEGEIGVFRVGILPSFLPYALGAPFGDPMGDPFGDPFFTLIFTILFSFRAPHLRSEYSFPILTFRT